MNRLRKRYGRSSSFSASPWPADEARRHRNIARHMFAEGHSYPHKGVDVDNCGYCALTHGGQEGPNYAGWARIYIEAGRSIPKKWEHAFDAELNSDNAAYSSALKRSIVTFGGPRFA